MQESRESPRPISQRSLPPSWATLQLNDSDWFVPVGVTAFAGRKPYFSTGSIQASNRAAEGEFGFSDRPTRANRMAQKWDVLQARMAGASKAVMVDEALSDSLFSTGFMQWRPPAFPETLGPWLFYAVQTPDLLAQRDRLASGTTQVSLSDGNLAQITVPIAPLAEQRRVVEAIETRFARLDAAVKALERARANLTRLQNSVLNALWDAGGDQAVTLGEVLSEALCNGISIKGTEGPPGTPSLRLSAMSDGGFDYSDRKYIEIDSQTAEDLSIQENDFFISRGNGSLHLVGRGTLAQHPPERVVFPDTMTRARLDPRRVDPRWVAMMWRSDRVHRQVRTRVKTTAGIYKISQPQMASIEFPLPPLAAQASLSDEGETMLGLARHVLTEVTNGIGKASRLRLAILRSAFEGHLVPQDPNDEPASALLERIRTANRAISSPARRARRSLAAE